MNEVLTSHSAPTLSGSHNKLAGRVAFPAPVEVDWLSPANSIQYTILCTYRSIAEEKGERPYVPCHCSEASETKRSQPDRIPEDWVGLKLDQIEMSEWQGGPVVKSRGGRGGYSMRERACNIKSGSVEGHLFPTLCS